MESVNVGLIVGTLARNPIRRQLKNGDEVLTLDVRVKSRALKTIVPVSWVNPPAWAANLSAGNAVGVRGAIRQIWYTNNNRFTDLLADKVVRVASGAGQRKFLDDALAVIEEVDVQESA